MKINRLNLVQDMNKVLPGIATGTMTIENADTVVFNEGHLYSYNSSISVDVVESEPTGLKGVVKGIDFYNCLMKLPGDEIECEVTKDNWIFTDNSIKVKIKLLPEGKLFERFTSLKPTDNWIKIDGEDFSRSLRICNMPKNSSKFAGIYFKNHDVLSTDTFAINHVVSKNDYPEVFISNAVVAELLKWNNFTEIQYNKMWLQLKTTEGTVFSARTLDITKFPSKSILQSLDKRSEIKPDLVSEFSNDFFSAIDRAASFSSENDGHQVINFDIFADMSVITSERISGAYEEKILNIKSENPINLKLDVQLMQSCASYFRKFKIITNGESKNILLEADNAYKLVTTIA